MELQTIGQVSKLFNISTRTLRYYEQIGLIKPEKNNENSYRVYDANDISKLHQIIILRKLRIPLKQIAEIIKSSDAKAAIEIFTHNLSEIDSEITALSSIRNVLEAFIKRLNIKGDKLMLLEDESLLEIVDSLTITNIKFKEEKVVENLNQAEQKLNKLTDRDVRIVYLPPSDVAAYQYEGDEPEAHVGDVMNTFVIKSNLTEIKPDIRQYGFNAPNPEDGEEHHGYEVWVTIPDNFDVPAPIMKKHFEGGLYAARMIPFGAFEEWGWLFEWVMNNDKYEYRGDWNPENMFGNLEETLNYVNRVHNQDLGISGLQLDLLIPIKERV